jgi:hypothetical protein
MYYVLFITYTFQFLRFIDHCVSELSYDLYVLYILYWLYVIDIAHLTRDLLFEPITWYFLIDHKYKLVLILQNYWYFPFCLTDFSLVYFVIDNVTFVPIASAVSLRFASDYYDLISVKYTTDLVTTLWEDYFCTDMGWGYKIDNKLHN